MKIELFKEEVEKWLKEYFKNKTNYNKKIYEAMSYSLNIGGKRIRPILLLATYDMFNSDHIEVLPIAGALEMIHTYSLIHDDLPCMDDDDLRRGYPTNHKVYGEAIAVLAGDALLNEAMNIMFNYCILKGKKEIEACSLISNSAGAEGMIGGQVVDILGEGRKISEEELRYMHSKKTGELIKVSILAGAILGNAKKEEIEILKSYGEKLGLAFQIKDDILDIIGNTNVLGKKVKSDENNDKTTFVTVFGLDKCKELCVSLTEECTELLNKIEKDTTVLRNLTDFLLKREY